MEEVPIGQTELKKKACHPDCPDSERDAKDLNVIDFRRLSCRMLGHRLIRKIPAKIDTIPAHCQREICSLRKIAASATVTAPYSELSTLMIATCSMRMP